MVITSRDNGAQGQEDNSIVESLPQTVVKCSYGREETMMTMIVGYDHDGTGC